MDQERIALAVVAIVTARLAWGAFKAWFCMPLARYFLRINRVKWAMALQQFTQRRRARADCCKE